MQARIISLFLAFTAMTAAAPAGAQEARAWLDSTSIRIGEQLDLHLELTQPAGAAFEWPAVPDTLGRIEVLRRSNVQAEWSSDSSSLTRRQSLRVTCFDSGYYAIPPFVFRDSTDTASTAETQPMLLAVHTIEVDTSKAIRDIKPTLEEPYTWRDILPWALAGLALAGAAWLGVLYYRRRRMRRQAQPVRKVPTRPAHEIAIESLRALEDEKRWQQGDYKGYHTHLTDILRTYIEHRWQVAAMEMTTEDILRYPVIYKLPSDNVAQLKYMLELADYVKFAKMVPVAHENEQCLKYAYDFVLDTRLAAVPAAAEPGAEETEKEVVS